tara:strand:+ start:558 stop:686 length:129 start_codon:yes stop_codon:yes gene_type:complete
VEGASLAEELPLEVVAPGFHPLKEVVELVLAYHRWRVGAVLV